MADNPKAQMNLQAITSIEETLQNAGLIACTRPSGEKYYCFSEVKTRFFSSVPIGTLKTWTRTLNITKEKCSQEEHDFFKTALPHIAIGAFKLISYRDTLRMLKHCHNRVRELLGPFCSSTPKKPCFNTNTSVVESLPAQSLQSFGEMGSCNNYVFTGNAQKNPVKNVCVNTHAIQLNTDQIHTHRNSDFQNNFASNSSISKILDSSDISTTHSVTSVNCPASFSFSALKGAFHSPVDERKYQSSFNNDINSNTGAICKVVYSSNIGTGSSPPATTVAPVSQLIEDDITNRSYNFGSVIEQKSEGNVSNSKQAKSDSAVVISDCDEEANNVEYDIHLPNSLPQGFKFKGRHSRILSLSDLSGDTASNVKSLKSFYLKPLNPKRVGHVLKHSTVDKMVERLCSFFKFLKDSKALSPSLHHVEDSNLVEEFCNSLRSEQRNLRSSTISRHISAFINVVRFINQDLPLVGQENLASLSRLRALQSQLEFDARREQRAKSDKSSNTVLYEEILQIVRKLKNQFEDASSIHSKARSLMNFSVLLLYTTASPGRSKEFVTLRITDSENNAIAQQGNFLIVEPKGMTLLCKEYKTSNSYGADRTELTSADLVYYLRLYIEKFRFKLLQGNMHDFLFVNHHGLPFTVPGFNKYLGSLFNEECGLRLSVNDLRKILVTFFMSLPEAADNQLSESVARLMKHTQRTQKRVYDCRSQHAIKSPALAFLASKATAEIFHDDYGHDDPGLSRSPESKEEQDVKPLPGDFIALVASNSTTASPQILLAKLLRYTRDGKEALLASMTEEISMEDFLTDEPCPSDNLYIDFENITLRVTSPDGEIYDFLVNGTRFKDVSSFFEAYCRCQSDRMPCSLCSKVHACSTLCIPAYFDPEAIACLINLINGCVPLFNTPVDCIAVIKIAGFLLIKEYWLRDNLFSFRWLSTKSLYRHCTIIFELYRNGYSSLVHRFAKRIQLPLLRQHRSVRSFYRHCRRIQRRGRHPVAFVQFKHSREIPWAVYLKGYHCLDLLI